MSFLKNPNLPKAKVKMVMIGERYVPRLKGALNKLGVEILSVPESAYLDKTVSSHADMTVFHSGGPDLFCPPSIKETLVKRLDGKKMNIYSGIKEPHGKYPLDIAYNGAVINDIFIYLEGGIDPEIWRYMKVSGKKMIPVKQGYCKCSVAVIDENSAITSDVGIYNKLTENDMDVLLISNGNIRLEGLNYGFIGGCCGKISDKDIAFTGIINSHPDKDKILNFINDKGMTPHFLTDDAIFDVGSILPIVEEEEKE